MPRLSLALRQQPTLLKQEEGDEEKETAARTGASRD
jgi:hypothetical protein